MTRTPRLKVVPLGSGSSGNCTVVTDGETTLLVDCGFSAVEVSRRLQAAGFRANDISALLITHEHGDHVRGLDVFCRRHAPQALVYTSSGTARCRPFDRFAGDVTLLRPGAVTRVGGLDIMAFRTSHDAAEPFGYRIESDDEAVGIATDTGSLTDEVIEGLAGCDTVAIESNHDVEMLERGPYPAYLKRRILSAEGHLSNSDAARALERLASDRLRHVIGMHRSETNNTARLASAALTRRLAEIGLSVPVTIALQHAPVGF